MGAVDTDTKSQKKVMEANKKLRGQQFKLQRSRDRIEELEHKLESLKMEKNGVISQRDVAKEDLVKLQEQLKKRMARLRESLGKVADEELKKDKPLTWGQSIDSVWGEIPEVLSIIDFDERIRPPENCGEVAELRVSCKDEGGNFELTSFVASKRERGIARLSEDRIGFHGKEGGFRALALDGVGGSVHSRHLVRSIAGALLDSDEVAPVIRDELERFGDSMISGEVDFDHDDKTAFFQERRLGKGSSCVLAVVDYDEASKSVLVSQVGDVVAFVETRRGWRVVPEEFSKGKEFDSRPIQVSTNNPDSVDGIRTIQIEDATGRVAVATDGVAGFILGTTGVDDFIDMVELDDGDAEGLLKVLRKKGIEDDDLSFLMASPLAP
jgi:hypothetical protein